MNKVLAIAFIGILAVSCSKKNDKFWQDTNTMLQEPETTVVDSSAAKTPVDQGAVSANADNKAASENTAPADSAAAK